MKSWKMRCIALCLTVFMLLSVLTGCHLKLSKAAKRQTPQFVLTDYSDMEYVRPDMDALEEALDACLKSAEDDDFSQLEEDLYNYTLLYNDFCTNYYLADIYYCTDMTDSHWMEEYNFCMDASTEASAGLDELFFTLADSEHRGKLETEDYYGEDFFDDYEGESLWDDTFTALMEEESQLISRYYELSGEAIDAGYREYYQELAPEMCQVYVDLVLVRQRIAEYVGYSSYPEFAYDFYYVRDYTPRQEEKYLRQVREYLVPIYYEYYSAGGSDIRLRSRDEDDTFAYVEEMAKSMDGTVLEAFELMRECHLYDITQGENKYNASFEVFLPSYSEPFVFMNPIGSEYDYLTFAHEFGHFCNDYASDGASVSIDVAEVFSQGMEYLSLFYVEGTERLRTVKMEDSLCTYVEQSAYADFEQRVYAMDPDELTVQNVFDLFEEVGEDYGFDVWGFDSRDFVSVTHFFTNPCYVFSYVVSNDAAIQLYQMEQAESGAGLELLQEHLDTEEACFLAFVESAGLESPFAKGRIEAVAETFREILE